MSLAAFVVVERRVTDPVLDLDLVLHNRLFAAANTAALLNYMALYAISLLTAIYLEVVQGRSAGLTGWLMLGQPVMQAVLSPFAGRLSDRIGSRVLTTSGMVLTAAGMVLLAIDAGLGRHPARGREPRRRRRRSWPPSARPTRRPSWAACGATSSSLASAFLGTARVVGMALSVAVLGGIAASQLGRARRPPALHARPRRRRAGQQGRERLRSRLLAGHVHRRRPGAARGGRVAHARAARGAAATSRRAGRRRRDRAAARRTSTPRRYG